MNKVTDGLSVILITHQAMLVFQETVALTPQQPENGSRKSQMENQVMEAVSITNLK